MNLRLLAVATLWLIPACAFRGAEPVEGSSAECTTYCDLMEDNCSKLFEDRSECLTACKEYPSEPEDIIGEGPTARDDNTVECRIYHANNAAATPNGAHCQHASPVGAPFCVDFKGACGDYCGVVIEACSEAEGAFEDIDACETACNALQQGEEGQTTGDTVHCRLSAARKVVSDQNPDLCPDALVESPRCRM